MAIVYVLKSLKDEKTYTGSTTNIDRRLKEHNRGIVNSTSNRRPLILIYQEKQPSLILARKREKYLKPASGRKLLRKTLHKIINDAG